MNSMAPMYITNGDQSGSHSPSKCKRAIIMRRDEREKNKEKRILETH